MDNPRIVFIEWGYLEGRRPRAAGSNARLNEHGAFIRLPIMRLKTEDGSSGFGLCLASRDHASRLLGKRLGEVFLVNQGVAEPWLAFDYPLWDLIGQRAGLPVYILAAATNGAEIHSPYRSTHCSGSSVQSLPGY